MLIIHPKRYNSGAAICIKFIYVHCICMFRIANVRLCFSFYNRYVSDPQAAECEAVLYFGLVTAQVCDVIVGVRTG